MLQAAQSMIRRVGKQIGLGEDEIVRLLAADAEHLFHIELASGKKHQAYRVQHNNAHGPYKGGVRFHPEVSLDEVRALATLMSIKTAAIGLPMGGGKGGVAVDPQQLSEAELEELARKYVAHLAPHIGPDKDVPAPDVNTNARVIDWMVDEFEKQTGDTSRASFTGKSISKGGSLGREAATGRGGVIVLWEMLSLLGQAGQDTRIALQGFGNVGAFFALVAQTEHPEWLLVAATDSSGGLAHDDGLTASELAARKRSGRRLKDYQASGSTFITSDDLIKHEADVLVLAALGDAINKANMKQVKAKIILELANGPIDEAAYDYLTQKGVLIVPDVLANAGGVIVSYLEWLQNKQGKRWTEESVNQKLAAYLVPAIKNAYKYAEVHHVSLKEAAFALAIRRILGK